MFNKTITTAILAACMFTATTFAGVVITHNGATDPVNEGWTLHEGAGATTGPIDDNGTAAWFVDDNSTAGGGAHYVQYLDSADVADGINNGWSMDVTLRVVDIPDNADPAVWANVTYDNTYFALVFGSQSDGDPIVSVGYALSGPSPQYVLEGSGGGYHDYSLVYDPTLQSVDLFVDGTEVISNVAGVYYSDSNDMVRWGSGTSLFTGHGNYSSLTFAIPEPATMSLIGLFAGGVIFVRRLFPAS